MRIAYFSHFYPPSQCGGAGYYTKSIAEAISRQRINVKVLCAGLWQSGTEHINGWEDDVYDGIPVRRVHMNWLKAPAPFDYLFDNRNLDPVIRRFCKSFSPDLVHITSCYTLSARVIPVVKSLGIPVILHLVDYWFICPRHTLLRKNGELCFGGYDAWDCQNCMLFGSKIDRVTKRLLTLKSRRRLFENLGKNEVFTRCPGSIGQLGNMERRRRYTLEQLLRADLVISPSHALRQLYENNGVPRGRVQVIRYGHDTGWADSIRRNASTKIRFGFIGNVLPIKGVHVLLDAFSRLQPDDGIELHIHGDDTLDMNYSMKLKQSLPPNSYWHGRYGRAELRDILGSIDVIVVPSLWHENTPLVIQEAFAAGCPVITSNLAGSAEGVENGKSGLHFKCGDAADLMAKMQVLAERPDELALMRDNLPSVKTVEQEVEELMPVYMRLV